MAQTSVLVLVLLLLAGLAAGRSISDPAGASALVSDGAGGFPASLLRIGRLSAAETCEESYGFLPCTTSVVGNLFLILVYGYLMFMAATYLSSGSELLLEVLGPGVVGGLFLPMLGALPDAILILGLRLLLLCLSIVSTFVVLFFSRGLIVI